MYGADLKILITFSIILFCGNFLANAKNNLHKYVHFILKFTQNIHFYTSVSR